MIIYVDLLKRLRILRRLGVLHVLDKTEKKKCTNPFNSSMVIRFI